MSVARPSKKDLAFRELRYLMRHYVFSDKVRALMERELQIIEDAEKVKQ